eukprot:TRINITY_DN113015_c0_g1_i1.p1 TRINITY_DN113015_c0_g1~~TRINITY_DN113015_c0_g1_i1.p1  ORF type:complete len:404 (+),score=70.77 TRINITY_DN113015_c0_g1_i1:69-1280(+)
MRSRPRKWALGLVSWSLLTAVWLGSNVDFAASRWLQGSQLSRDTRLREDRPWGWHEALGTSRISRCAFAAGSEPVADLMKVLELVAPVGFTLAVVLGVLLLRPWTRGSLSASVAEALAPITGALQAKSLKISDLPGCPAYGAEVTGLALTSTILPQTSQQLQSLLGNKGVLLFRGQDGLSPADVLAIAEVFGQAVPAHGQSSPIGLYVVKDRDREARGQDFWHSDNSFEQVPGGPTLLYALKVPVDASTGASLADTLFADAVAAAKMLPAELRRRVTGLDAAHNRAYNAGVVLPSPEAGEDDWTKLADATHPVLRRHPTTGQEALFVAPAYVREIRGVDQAESADLLNNLFKYLLQPTNIYSHEWREGDVLVWDNGCVVHKATTLELPPGAERAMYRVQTILR